MSNRNIAKALGMAEPDRVKYTVGDREVQTDTPALAGPAQEVALPDMVEDDVRIRGGDRQIDDLIAEGMTALRETFEEAGDMEPRSKSRAREVGATIMAVTLSAIRHKQDFAVKNKQQRMREATWSGSPTTVSNTQINNIITSRNDIMKMMRGEPPVGTVVEMEPED